MKLAFEDLQISKDNEKEKAKERKERRRKRTHVREITIRVEVRRRGRETEGADDKIAAIRRVVLVNVAASLQDKSSFLTMKVSTTWFIKLRSGDGMPVGRRTSQIRKNALKTIDLHKQILDDSVHAIGEALAFDHSQLKPQMPKRRRPSPLHSSFHSISGSSPCVHSSMSSMKTRQHLRPASPLAAAPRPYVVVRISSLL